MSDANIMTMLQETTQEFLKDFWHLSTNEVEVINTIFEKKSTVPKKDDIIVIFNKVLSKINLVDRHGDKKRHIGLKRRRPTGGDSSFTNGSA